MLPRVVLDTSDHVKSVLYPPGASGAIVDSCASGRCQMVCSLTIISEIRDVLSRARIRRRYSAVTDEAVEAYVMTLQAIADMVPGILELRGASIDPKDDHVLACAVEGRADYLISADKAHLLSLREFAGIKIVTAAEFLAISRLQKT